MILCLYGFSGKFRVMSSMKHKLLKHDQRKSIKKPTIFVYIVIFVCIVAGLTSLKLKFLNKLHKSMGMVSK